MPMFACGVTLASCGGARHSTASSSSASIPAPHGASAASGGAALSGQLSCSSAQLRLSYVGTQGATGHLEATFVLRNVSARRCRLRGYPGAQLFDPAGNTLPTHVQRGAGFFPDTRLRVKRILLAPGAAARFGLSFATGREFAGGRACPSAARLESVPPNAYAPLTVTLTGGGRPRFAPCGGVLVASPVYSG